MCHVLCALRYQGIGNAKFTTPVRWVCGEGGALVPPSPFLNKRCLKPAWVLLSQEQLMLYVWSWAPREVSTVLHVGLTGGRSFLRVKKEFISEQGEMSPLAGRCEHCLQEKLRNYQTPQLAETL